MLRCLQTNRRISHRTLSAACLLLSLPIAQATAAKTKSPPLTSVQTELIGPLDFAQIKDGSTILARVVTPYDGTGCRLRVGAIVEGRVTQVPTRSATQKSSQFQIAFNKADCNDHPSSAYNFTLIALVGAPTDLAFDPDSNHRQGPPLADAPARNELYFSNFSNSLSGAYTSVPVNRTSGPASIIPPNIALGQVVDVSRTTLSVGAGLNGASILSTSAHNPTLHAHSILLLSPSSGMTIATPTSARIPITPEAVLATSSPHSSAAAPVAAPPPPTETELCSSNCNIVGSMTSRVRNATTISASIPITALGYSPHVKGFISSFDDETTLTYLDQTHLLCTFDPHQLRVRDSDDTDPIRPIRAVLIDTTTHTVLKVMEWRVRGNLSYLWHLGNGEILVHTGDQLRRYDANLNPLKSIPVDGPVAWVVASPSSDHIAVAVLHMRYTQDVYQQLRKFENEPDKDLNVSVYDHDFNLLSTSIRSALTSAPVLSDQGELRLTRITRDRWKLGEYSWDKSLHNIATLTSACMPRLSVPEHNLIFATGCTQTPSGTTNWYRVLRPDGHSLLSGESPADETAQPVRGSLANSFAIRVFKSSKEIDPNASINRSDYIREEIGIYRATNGSRISSIATDDFILAQNASALSPAGNQMALAGKNSILFYDLKLP